jgi:hypothetical protein
MYDIDKLSMAIRNTPCDSPYTYTDCEYDCAYKEGHRDARHAAVEILLEHFKDVQQAAPEAPAYWNSQRKMIERAIIGLRDGWATRKDAEDALAALASAPAAQQAGAATVTVSVGKLSEPFTLSAATTASASIDTPEFLKYLLAYMRATNCVEGSIEDTYAALIAHIDSRAKAHSRDAAPAEWTQDRITDLAKSMAEEVAKNCGTVPQLTFPHIYLGLTEALARAALAQQGAHGTPVTNSHASNAGEDTERLDDARLEPLLERWFGLEFCTNNFNPKRMLAFVNAAIAASAKEKK